MNPEMKRFIKRYRPVYDGISSADVDQEARERIARQVADRLEGEVDFRRDLFVSLASDPLVPCAGYDRDGEHHACPKDIRFRVAMHNSAAPDGRSAAWRSRPPTGSRCVSCGFEQFVRAAS